MALSRNKLSQNNNSESKQVNLGEVMPPILEPTQRPGPKDILIDYVFDGNPELFQCIYTMFGKDMTPMQASNLVHIAGPLGWLEAIIRKNPKLLSETFKINGMEGTLLQLAIIGLDHTPGSYS